MSEMPMQKEKSDDRWKGYLIGGASIVLGVFILVWVMFGNAQSAAFLVFLILENAALAAAIVIVMRTMHRDNLAHVANTLANTQSSREPAIEGDWTIRQPQLSAPSSAYQLGPAGDTWAAVENNVMVRKDQIERAATKVYIKLYPHTQPTRENIEQVMPEMKSHGMVTAVMGFLAEKGVVENNGNPGSAYHWRT